MKCVICNNDIVAVLPKCSIKIIIFSTKKKSHNQLSLKNMDEMHASKTLYVNLNILVNGREIKTLTVLDYTETYLIFTKIKKHTSVWFLEPLSMIIQQFSSLRTSFLKQTVHTIEVANFDTSLIANVFICLTVCYFEISKISYQKTIYVKKEVLV